MKQAIALVTALLVLATAFYGIKIAQTDQKPSINQYLSYQAQTCTEKLEIECAIDIERTVVACAKAFETGGVDLIADIKCAKDLLSDKKHCWPCICAQAKKKGWHIVGC